MAHPEWFRKRRHIGTDRMNADILKLADSTRAARARTKDASICTRAKGGKVQVCRVTYRASGTSNVEPRTLPMTIPEAIAFMDSL
jgi:hypothetical protein